MIKDVSLIYAIRQDALMSLAATMAVDVLFVRWLSAKFLRLLLLAGQKRQLSHKALEHLN